MTPGDYGDLGAQLQLLTHYPDALTGQHAIRQWEYAMALRAISAWAAIRNGEGPDPLSICDVGGAGSGFWKVLTALTSEDIIVVDPSVQPGSVQEPGQHRVYACPIEDYAATTPHDRFDVVTCISVIEHVKEVRKFFRAIRMLLKPGGLLFVTTDYWGAEGADTAHFHWMRERIYNADSMRKLLGDLRELGYRSFGSADWTYHGAQVYDYSVCSAAMVRRER